MAVNNKLYMYLYNVDMEIPDKIETVPIELLLGSTVTDLHKQIENHSKLFAVFAKLNDSHIIVPSEKEASVVKKILDTLGTNGEYDDFVVSVKPSLIWYTDKVEKNIIISTETNWNSKVINSFFSLYLEIFSTTVNQLTSSKVVEKKKAEIYKVVNIRSGSLLIKVPRLQDAIDICNRNPCCVVRNNKNEIVHRSKYGKVNVPNNKVKVLKNPIKKNIVQEGRKAAKFSI